MYAHSGGLCGGICVHILEDMWKSMCAHSGGLCGGVYVPIVVDYVEEYVCT